MENELSKFGEQEKRFRSVAQTKKAFAYLLNSVVAFGFCGVSAVIASLTLVSQVYHNSPLYWLLPRSSWHYLSAHCVELLVYFVPMIVLPIIPLTLFCMPRCPRCGEKFNYPKYTSDPDECLNCHLVIEKKIHKIGRKKKR